MRGSGPSEEFGEGGGDLLVAKGMLAGEVHGGVGLAGFRGRSPVKIAGTVGGKAEASSPAVGDEVDSEILSGHVHREKGLDPFWGGVGRRDWAADFEAFGEESLVVFIEGQETLREEGGNALLDFGRMGMDQAGAEGITGGLKLCGRLAGTKLKESGADAADDDPEQKGDSQWAEDFNEESLHGPMILQLIGGLFAGSSGIF
jgi:hypothetical protein